MVLEPHFKTRALKFRPGRLRMKREQLSRPDLPHVLTQCVTFNRTDVPLHGNESQATIRAALSSVWILFKREQDFFLTNSINSSIVSHLGKAGSILRKWGYLSKAINEMTTKKYSWNNWFGSLRSSWTHQYFVILLVSQR